MTGDGSYVGFSAGATRTPTALLCIGLAYNAWCDDVHLGEVIEIDGFVRAQRFKVADLMPGVTDQGYVAFYELETDDPGSAMAALRGRMGSFAMTEASDLVEA